MGLCFGIPLILSLYFIVTFRILDNVDNSFCFILTFKLGKCHILLTNFVCSRFTVVLKEGCNILLGEFFGGRGLGVPDSISRPVLHR